MPQRVKDIGFTYTPMTLHKVRPDHMAAIGLVAGEWSALEGHLSSIVSLGLFTFSQDEAAAGPIVAKILTSIDSIEKRLDVIRKLLQPRIGAELLKQFTDDIAPAIRKRAKERNLVVHGYWGIAPEHPNHLVLSPRGGANMAVSLEFESSDYLLYTVDDLLSVAQRINDTVNAIGGFTFRLVHEKTPLPWLPPTAS
ncbi:hypothetical protein [Bradyrhizobium sp. 150]|uniref:hypothetical protein n=1 Tax=Bradyrhizobium sp. 150 TaxID=2782625 RepID=UPI001FFAC437|nr:hypothetical protein [Bradyrhizobium sp. 150]MCK1676638.1 hypothetical protein [Bradyrhizobium sp. 150]